MICLCLACCALFALQAKDVIRGDQNVTKTIRTIQGAFEQIVVNADFNVTIVYGITPQVEIESESNLQPYINTTLKGKTLNINVDKKVDIVPSLPITLTVTMSNLSKLQFKGKGDISVTSVISSKLDLDLNGEGTCKFQTFETGSLKLVATDAFKIEFNEVKCGGGKMTLTKGCSANFTKFTGGSKFELQHDATAAIVMDLFTADQFKATCTGTGALTVKSFVGKDVLLTLDGSGNIVFSGTAQGALTITNNKSSVVDASELQIPKAKVENNGTGDVTVNVLKNIDVTIASSGSVIYKGKENPSIKLVNTGTGQIIKK